MGWAVTIIVCLLWVLLVVIGKLVGLTVFLTGWVLKLLVVLACLVWLMSARTGKRA